VDNKESGAIRPLVIRTAEQLNGLRKYAIEHNLPENIYEDFGVFARIMRPSWGDEELEWQWFHDYMCKYYQSIIDGKHNVYTVEAPPQIGKSVLLVLFLLYSFGINPNLRAIYYTYSEDRAIEVVKDYILPIMASDKYNTIFPHILLKSDMPKRDKTSKNLMQSKTSTLKDNEFTLSDPFGNNYRGKLVARGSGQGVQGKSADLAVIDDYAPSSQAVSSENFRRKLKRWMITDVISRFQKSTKFVIVCTRWYADDCIGVARQKVATINEQLKIEGISPLLYKSIKLRAEYRITDDNPPEDPRKKSGDWLWRDFIPKFLWAKGEEDYEAMYNCDESAADFRQQITERDFGYYDELPDVAGRYMFSIDGASTTNKNSDHTAIGYWFVSGFRRYLVKLWYVKMEIPDLTRFVKGLLDEYDYDECLIEFASAGVPLSQSLKDDNYNNITKLGFSGRPIESKTPTKNQDKIAKGNSKMERYLRCIPEFMFEEKRIYVPKADIEHLKTFMQQLTTFDGVDGKADDMVDMATYLIYYTSRQVVKMSKVNTPSGNTPARGNMSYGMFSTQGRFLRR